MAVLVATVIVVGALCAIDLLLTFGVIRRLRHHTALLNSRSGETIVMQLSIGDTPGPFTAATFEGEQLITAVGLRVAAFFSSSCSICPRRVPAFVDYLRTNRVSRKEVLAVILADDGEPVPYLNSLAEVAQVCVEPTDGALSAAFQVTGFPAFCLLDGKGTVEAIDYDPAQLPGLVARAQRS